MSTKRALIREEILRVSTELFTSEGYQQTSVNNIAEKVGISRVTFYAYFTSKPALLTEIFETSLRNYYVALKELLQQPLTRAEKIRQVMAHRIDSLTKDQPIFRLLFREQATMPKETITAVEKIQADIDRAIEKEIETGIKKGEIIDENPKLLMYAFTGMSSWLYHWYDPGGDIRPEEIVRVFSRLLEHGGLSQEIRTESRAVIRSLESVKQQLSAVEKELTSLSQSIRVDRKPGSF